ncbi:phosphoribosyl-ATP pyrophosphatase [Kozakia baliensis]|uniref:phosphoribosyl-ATP pyrophosphatase n=1 Tax=Kozakia baliensis TaxID=153496 RepID=UPI00087A2EE5|nr:hypothetical protein [Kozakia baliensis]AOX19960.1 hypothetical protein A0U90_06295 [Kozakia baliensis]
MTTTSDAPHAFDKLAQRYRSDRTAEVAPPATPQEKSSRRRARPPAFTPTPEITALSERLGVEAMRCTAAFTTEQYQELIHESASILETLARIWGARNIPSSDVLLELDHRMQLGELLLRLNSDGPRSEHAPHKMWRPNSTKLP